MHSFSRSSSGKEEEAADNLDASCACVRDPFASLPPELRPKPQPKEGGLRKATCPGCGLEFWTNRETDYCIKCEKSA